MLRNSASAYSSDIGRFLIQRTLPYPSWNIGKQPDTVLAERCIINDTAIFTCVCGIHKKTYTTKSHYICEFCFWFYLLITRCLHDCVHVCFLSLSIFRDLGLSHHYCTLLTGSQCAWRLCIVLFNIFLNFLFLSVNTLPKTQSNIIWCALKNTTEK